MIGTLLVAAVAFIIVMLFIPRKTRLNYGTADTVGMVSVVLIISVLYTFLLVAGLTLLLMLIVGVGVLLDLPINWVDASIPHVWWAVVFFGVVYALCVAHGLYLLAKN